MKFKLAVLLILLLKFSLFPQNEQTIIAQIGDEVITSSEFRLRYELSPFVSMEKGRDNDSIKYDFLYSLIAEKLWSIQAKEMGYEQKKDFQFYFKPLEEIILRDALFKTEIENKVKLSANDINAGIAKYQTSLKILVLSSKDSSAIFNFYIKAKNDDFDSVLTRYSLLEKQSIEIKLGTLKDEEIEDILYNLNVNEFTYPEKSEIGWVIFQIKDKSSVPIDLSDEKLIKDIKKIIMMRRIEKRHNEYLENLLSGIKISADEKIFFLAADKIVKRFMLKRPHQTPDSSKVRNLLEDADYRSIKSEIGEDNLSEPLFTIFEKSIPIRDFLGNLAFKEFSVSKIDSSAILQKLNQYLKIFINEQLITHQAYKNKINNLPDIKNEIEMWKDNYLAQMLKVSYLDSINVSDSEVYNYYLRNIVKDSNTVLINLQLVTLSNLDDISNILDRVNKGEDFGEIIKNFGKTDPMVNDLGETGLKPLIILEDISLIADKLELNQLYGPIRRNNGYSLFRVIDRQSDDSVKLSFESNKPAFRNQLRMQKLKDILNQKTAEFASDKYFKVNENILKNFKNPQIKMFVHRLMGFGGRIAAVPLTDNWTDWINTYEFKKKLFP